MINRMLLSLLAIMALPLGYTETGGEMQVLSGTSVASPYVAGAAALFLSSNPIATPAKIEKVIKDKAVNTGTQSKDGRAIIRLNMGGF
jgi:subtilisin family serine protease